MVLVATMIFVLSMLLSPSHGYIFEKLRKYRLRRHIDGEDVLKAIYKVEQSGENPTGEKIGKQAGLPLDYLKRLYGDLIREKLIYLENNITCLTDAGRKRALEMVRSHRLWESYLVDRANLDPDKIHIHAEKLEHAHELADEVDRSLGHPKQDPHGSEIPEAGH